MVIRLHGYMGYTPSFELPRDRPHAIALFSLSNGLSVVLYLCQKPRPQEAREAVLVTLKP